MKYFFLFITLTIACRTQENDMILINNFLNVLKNFDNSNQNDLLKFLEIDTSHVNKEEIIFFANTFKKNLKPNNYMVISYKEFKSMSAFKEYNCVYPNADFDNIYCLIVENNFISFIILNDSKDKIISFYSGIIKQVDKIHPIILN